MKHNLKHALRKQKMVVNEELQRVAMKSKRDEKKEE
jgi:hypothetical protein